MSVNLQALREAMESTNRRGRIALVNLCLTAAAYEDDALALGQMVYRDPDAWWAPALRRCLKRLEAEFNNRQRRLASMGFEQCPECGGLGEYDNGSPCDLCDGQGEIPRSASR